MECVNKNDIELDALPGRGLIRAVGKKSHFDSNTMSVGYARYSAEYGVMEPHQHVEETVIITSVHNGWVEWGNEKNELHNRTKLEEGMILHIPDGEWHAFTYDNDGYIEIIFIYSGTENVRPEDK